MPKDAAIRGVQGINVIGLSDYDEHRHAAGPAFDIERLGIDIALDIAGKRKIAVNTRGRGSGETRVDIKSVARVMVVVFGDIYSRASCSQNKESTPRRVQYQAQGAFHLEYIDPLARFVQRFAIVNLVWPKPSKYSATAVLGLRLVASTGFEREGVAARFPDVGVEVEELLKLH